jgi:hypothetical protein
MNISRIEAGAWKKHAVELIIPSHPLRVAIAEDGPEKRVHASCRV